MAVWVLATCGFLYHVKIDISLGVFWPIRYDQGGWSNGEVEKRERGRIAGEPVQYLVEFKWCVEKESWTDATNGQVKRMQESEYSSKSSAARNSRFSFAVCFINLFSLGMKKAAWLESLLSPLMTKLTKNKKLSDAVQELCRIW